MPQSQVDLQNRVDPGSVRETAPEPGTVEAIGTVSTLVIPGFNRNALHLYNDSDETIWVCLAADDAVVGEGIAIPAGTGKVISGYDGPVCAICTTGAKNLAVAGV